MRASDHLYFAPNIRFSELDLGGPKLSFQVNERFHGYYISPAMEMARSGHAFASGVLLVNCIDSLSIFSSGDSEPRFRFKRWCEHNLTSFNSKPLCDKVYLQFKVGIFNEARIKRGGEFNLKIRQTISDEPPILSINPILLAEEITEGLDKLIIKIDDDTKFRDQFTRRLRRMFKVELNTKIDYP